MSEHDNQLVTEWNDLQRQPGTTISGAILKRCGREIAILEEFQNLGYAKLPDGAVGAMGTLDEMMASRESVIRGIRRAVER